MRRSISKISKITGIGAAALAVALASCDLLEQIADGGERPIVEVVIGRVTAVRGGAQVNVGAGFLVEPADQIAVQANSTVKINVGANTFLANAGAQFRVAAMGEPDNGRVLARSGDFHFVARDGAPMYAAFGDVQIVMNDADATLLIDQSGRFAQFFVIRGQAVARHGNVETLIENCRAVMLDAAGVADDPNATRLRGNVLLWLAEWVGGPHIRQAASEGNCFVLPFGQIQFEGVDDDDPPPPPPPPPPRIADLPDPVAQPVRQRTPRATDADRVVLQPVTPREPPPPPRDPPPRPRERVVTRQVTQETFARTGIYISHITGPHRIHAGEEFSLRAEMTGENTPVGYNWRFTRTDNDSTFEWGSTTPQITMTLDNSGDYIVTFEALAQGGSVAASQRVRVRALTGQIVINAGGPYHALRDAPVSLLGNAKSRFSEIVRYDWYLTGRGESDFTTPENMPVTITYTVAGEHIAVFKVTLADNSFATDTAVVRVIELAPVANAGGDIVSSRGRRVQLRGSATPRGSGIMLYEWDFDGDGAFDWSSPRTGQTTHSFREFSHPVLRVTDSSGAFGLDTTRVVICPAGMVTVPGGRFCIDQFEWPNRRGQHPLVNITFDSAESLCASVGKRLCTESEWVRACRNDSDLILVDGHTFPYGNNFGASRCNVIDNPRSRNAVDPAGTYRDCAGSLSIFDMSGNAAEWVAPARGDRASAYGGSYQSSGAEESSCDSPLTLDRNAQYFYVGFRCCL